MFSDRRERFLEINRDSLCIKSDENKSLRFVFLQKMQFIVSGKDLKEHYPNMLKRLFLLVVCLPIIGISQVVLPQSGDKFNSPSTEYRLKQGDKISIKFLYQPELNETSLIVPPDGRVNLQLIDEFSVLGATLSQVKKDLDKAYQEILIKPIITVTLLEYDPPHVFVGGEVGKPGRYNLRDGQTLVQMVFLARGFTRDANKKLLIHARPDAKGDWIIHQYNLSEILAQKGKQKDLDLADGDYIYVPESKISQFNKAVEGLRGFLPRIF